MNGRIVCAVVAAVFLALPRCTTTGTGDGTLVTFSELIGTWIITSSHTTGTITYSHVSGTTLYTDSTKSTDTTRLFTDSLRVYRFHADSTFHGNGVAGSGDQLPVVDTGTFALSGSQLTLRGNAGDTTVGTATASGTTLFFTVPTSGQACLGTCYSYSYQTTFDAVRKQ